MKMSSQVLNFLWLGLDLPAPPDPEDGSMRPPMSPEYIENVRRAAQRHPDAQIDLWIDSKRLTKKQLEYLKKTVEHDLPNCHLCDLRSIPKYAQESLYSRREINPGWRIDSHSLIWRQVDAAKILISLQGNHDQVFFADLDHAHLDINSVEVQKIVKDHGIMIGSVSSKTLFAENQLWGFSRERGFEFFNSYYAEALQIAKQGQNAWGRLLSKTEEWLKDNMLQPEDILLPIDGDGSEAQHPGHKCGAGQLQEEFSATNRKKGESSLLAAALAPGSGMLGMLSSFGNQQTAPR